MSKLAKQKENCLNCGSALQGPYCSNCGQKALDNKQESFWKTIAHFLGDFVHFDSQIFRTAIPLLFRPGFLTNEYLAGRRTQYLNPIRSYVFLSLLFFFLFFTLDKSEEVKEVNVKGIPKMDSTSLQIDSAMRDEIGTMRDNNFQLSFDTVTYSSLEEYDSIQAAIDPTARDGFIKKGFIRKALGTKTRVVNEGAVDLVNEILDTFVHNFPKLFFILLPVFALLLKLLFFRKKMYYIEHLVFTIHFYNFFFLAGSLFNLLAFLIRPFDRMDSSVFALSLAIYLFFALKNVYENSGSKTFLKMLLLLGIFSCFVGIAFLVNLFISFMTI